MRFFSALAAAACLVGFQTSQSDAAVYQIDLAGEIGHVSSAFSDTVSVGDMATFSIIYDTDTPDANRFRHVGVFTDGILGVSATFGNQQLEMRRNLYLQTASIDNWLVEFSSLSYLGDATLGTQVGPIGVGLISSDSSAVSANSLPTELNLSDFDDANGFFFGHPLQSSLSGTFSSLSVTAVPLPLSGLLLITALGGLLLWSRSRRYLSPEPAKALAKV